MQDQELTVLESTDNVAEREGLPLYYDGTPLLTELPAENSNFATALNSGYMLVRSTRTGEAKTLPIDPLRVHKLYSISDFEMKDRRVRPRPEIPKR